MTRIVAGAARGRRLAVPPRGTRPTSDRAREALFSALGDVSGLRVLDLYAGSGAVGLEALSRGAGAVLLVERDRAAADVVRANLDVVRLPGGAVEQRPVETLAGRPNPGEAYDLVFADPPYELAAGLLAAALVGLARNGWLAAGATVVVERSARTTWTWPAGFAGDRDRRYGEAALWYGHATDQRPTSD